MASNQNARRESILVHRAPAPYGRACNNCARAKTKCMISEDGSAKCERCARLHKDCLAGAPRKRRSPAVAQISKASKLEAKLDDIASLLACVTRNAPGLAAILSESPQQTLASPVSENRSRLHDAFGSRDANPSVEPSVVSQSANPMTYPSPLASSCSVELSEGDEILEVFRTQMLKNLPLISLPENVNTEQLSAERPFLWLCIRSVCSKTWAQRGALELELRQTIAQKAVIGNEKSLDLFWGLLVYATWAQNCLRENPCITSIWQLALGQLFDLGLNRAQALEPSDALWNYDCRGCYKNFKPSPRTIEERRAPLCCFLITSAVSTFFKRIEGLRWTPYLDECLNTLAEHGEHPGDMILFHLIRIQQSNNKANQLQQQIEEYADSTDSAKIPLNMYLTVLQTQAEDLKRSIPPYLLDNELLVLSLHHLEINILGLACSKALVFDNSSFQRLELLSQCLRATTSWFYMFISISPSSYIGISTLLLTQFARCMLVLFKLSKFEDPGWDLNLVRRTANLSLFLEKASENMRQAGEDAGSTQKKSDQGLNESNMYSRTAQRLLGIKSWWDAQVAAEINAAKTTLSAPVDMPPLIWDHEWLRDPYGLWDYNLDQ